MVNSCYAYYMYRARRLHARVDYNRLLEYVAPSLLAEAHLPEANFIRTVRREMGRVAKTLAAKRAAGHERLDSLHVDGSELDQHSTVTAGVTAGGERIVLDASRTTIGKTADLECKAIEGTFADLAEMLDDWDKEAEAAGVAGAERSAAIGDSSRFGLHQLGGGGAVHGDNCAQALLLAAKIKEKITAAVDAQIAEAGVELDDDELEKTRAVYLVTCHHHLRNILVARGARASVVRLKELLEDELARVPKEKRVVVDVDALVRGVWKEFGTAHKNYAKGQGYKNFMPWLVENHVGKMYLAPPRGDCGSRHDFSTEAAMYLYHDRNLHLEFLQSRMYGDDNILEDAVFIMLSCVEVVGEIRARAIVHDKIVAPLRFFAGCKGLAWGPLDMSAVYNVLEKFLTLLAEDGSMLIDADLDVFEAFDDQPAYTEWKAAIDKETVALVRRAAADGAAADSDDDASDDADGRSRCAPPRARRCLSAAVPRPTGVPETRHGAKGPGAAATTTLRGLSSRRRRRGRRRPRARCASRASGRMNFDSNCDVIKSV